MKGIKIIEKAWKSMGIMNINEKAWKSMEKHETQ